MKTHWLWYWGFSQTKPHTHSPKKKFSDFDKMKEHSAKHAKAHQWVGTGYWSNYENSETIKEEALAKLARCFQERWVEIIDKEYNKIQKKAEILHPIEQGSSLHIYEEKYLINDTTYRFLYELGKRNNPQIEKLIK